MATRSISIALEAKVQGFVSGLRTAQQAARDTGNRMAAFARENEQHMDRVGKAGMVMGGALLAGVGLAVKAAMEFDSAMAEVRASTHETAANMDMLREAAINAGADTAFSAKEAANGIDELAKAGVSTKDVLNGGLKGALNLAAAGSLGVADAAEVSATALTQFKLQGKDIPHVADLLAAGAGKAQGSVKDIGEALKQSGLVASQFGMSVEDTTGTLAAFAKAGLVGSDSGTSLKTMLLKLAAPSKEAAETMSSLGIAAYDSSGKFVGVTNLAGQLKDKLGGLTQAQRDSTLATIFGTDAIRGANVLYEQGAQGISDWIDRVNEAGYASVTASIKQDNLAGDLEKLGGSFDSLLIKSGSGLAESLRGVVQGAEDFVDAIGKIPTPVLNAAVGIAGVVGGAALLGGAFLTVMPKIADFTESLDKIAPKGSKARGAIAGVGKAAGIAAAALVALQVTGAIFTERDTKNAEDYGQALLKVANGGKGLNRSGLDSVFQGYNKMFGSEIVTNVNNMSDAVRELTNQDFNDWMNQNMADPLNQMVGMSKTHIGQVTDRFKDLGDEMGNLAKNGGTETAAAAFKVLTQEFERNGKTAQDALNALPGYAEALKGLGNDAGVVVEGQDLLDFAMGKVPASMQAATGAVESYTNAQGQIVPVTPDVQEALDEIGVSAQGAATDLEKFTAALFASGLRTMGAREAEAAHEAAIDATKGAVEDATKAIEDQLVAQGYGAEAAKAMAEQQMGLGAALNKSKTDFDRTTDSGRILNAQFQSVASTGMAEIEAKAKAGAGMPELKTNLVDTFNALKKSGEGMGLTAGAAETLARKVMGIPPKANINSWMSDEAKRMAEQTTAAVDKVDGRVATVTVNTTYNETTIQRVIRELSGEDKPVGAGTVLAPPPAKKPKAGGGPVFGPGSGTSDDIPAMLSDGEHVWTAQEVAAAGGQAAIYRMRALAKAGMLPKFAGGGAAERRREALKYQTDARRGDGYRSVTESLSSAYSFADRLTSLADSGNVGAAAIRNLYTAAGRGEAGLKALHARSDRLSTSLERARDRVTDLAQIRDKVRSSLTEGFTIGDAVKRGNMYGSASMKDIQGSASSYLAKVQGFAGKLKALQKKGYSGAIVQEIAEMGLAEGTKAADVLLQGTPADVKALNKTKTAIDTAALSAGNAVTDAMYKGGINAAAGLVKGLQSQETAIEKQMLKIGLGMEAALKKALGIRSPSKKAEAIGNNFAGTLADRLAAGASPVAQKAKALGDAMSVVPKAYTPAVTYRPMPVGQAGGAISGPVTNNWTIHDQSNPVATAHEVARRQRALST